MFCSRFLKQMQDLLPFVDCNWLLVGSYTSVCCEHVTMQAVSFGHVAFFGGLLLKVLLVGGVLASAKVGRPPAT